MLIVEAPAWICKTGLTAVRRVKVALVLQAAVINRANETEWHNDEIMSVKALRVMLAGLACVATALNVRAAEILLNGDFEDEPNYPQNPAFAAYPFSGSAIPGWTIVTSATLHHLWGAGFPAYGYPTITGIYSLNTDGEGYNGNNCQIYQDFGTVNGGSYIFSFNWETWTVDAPLSLLHVSIQDLGTGTFVYNGLFDPTLVPNLSVQTAGTGFLGDGDAYRLEIQQTPQSGFNDNEYIVDDFSVIGSAAAPVPPGPPVPDVTTWSAEGITALAFAAIGFAMRRSPKLHLLRPRSRPRPGIAGRG